MQDRNRISLGRQGGMSLIGLILGLIVVGLIAVLAIKVIPAWLEYRTIKDGIVRVKEGGGSVVEMQKAFDRFADINNVTSLRGSDLIISKEGGEPEISFAYQKRIGLTEQASIVFEFDGTTDPSGVVAADD